MPLSRYCTTNDGYTSIGYMIGQVTKQKLHPLPPSIYIQIYNNIVHYKNSLIVSTFTNKMAFNGILNTKMYRNNKKYIMLFGLHDGKYTHILLNKISLSIKEINLTVNKRRRYEGK